MNVGRSGLAESGAHDPMAVSIHGMPAIPGLMCLPSTAPASSSSLPLEPFQAEHAASPVRQSNSANLLLFVSLWQSTSQYCTAFLLLQLPRIRAPLAWLHEQLLERLLMKPCQTDKTKTAHERKPTKAPKIPLSTLLHRGEAKNSGSYRLLLVPTTHFPSLSREDEQWTTSMRGRCRRRRRDAAAAMGPGTVAVAGGAAARRHGWGSWTPCSAPLPASCAAPPAFGSAPPAPRPASCSARERERWMEGVGAGSSLSERPRERWME